MSEELKKLAADYADGDELQALFALGAAGGDMEGARTLLALLADIRRRQAEAQEREQEQK